MDKTYFLLSMLLALALCPAATAQELESHNGMPLAQHHKAADETDKDSGTTRPVPDPTFLTTQQLIREIGMSRDVIETRLAGMDKAIELLQRTTDKIPLQIKDEVGQLQALHAEKFSSFETQLLLVMDGIKTQFLERDERTKQLALLSETAIAAALQAQKEAAAAQNFSNTTAADKMEGNFAKLIEQTQALLSSQKTAADDKIGDIKDRGNIVEGRLTLMEGQSKGGGDAWAYMFAVGSGAIALLTLIAFVVVNLKPKTAGGL